MVDLQHQASISCSLPGCVLASLCQTWRSSTSRFHCLNQALRKLARAQPSKRTRIGLYPSHCRSIWWPTQTYSPEPRRRTWSQSTSGGAKETWQIHALSISFRSMEQVVDKQKLLSPRISSISATSGNWAKREDCMTIYILISRKLEHSKALWRSRLESFP